MTEDYQEKNSTKSLLLAVVQQNSSKLHFRVGRFFNSLRDLQETIWFFSTNTLKEAIRVRVHERIPAFKRCNVAQAAAD